MGVVKKLYEDLAETVSEAFRRVTLGGANETIINTGLFTIKARREEGDIYITVKQN